MAKRCEGICTSSYRKGGVCNNSALAGLRFCKTHRPVEDTVDVALHSHGMGQENAVTEVIRWLELRAARRIGAARYEATAIADLLKTGDWLKELEELSKCKSK